ncbi:MAG: adenosylcobinamide-GDP ribazoletransferase [Actinobacteria bacterium]|nr:adenosylcobinamide-GDP ribazoletransferase [Actinomycetota bacterium]
MVRVNLLAALQFLTRVPIRLRREPSLPDTIAWVPVAGAIIGAAVGGVAAGLWFVVPPVVAGAVAVVVGLLITGAFHEDGLGDIADAFGGGWTVERRLEILKDSRHGTYGVAAICASIVVRMIALWSLPGPWAMFTGAVAAHTMGRVAAVAMAGSMKLATHSGLGADYGRGTTRPRAAVGVIAGIAITTLAVGWWAAALTGAALVAVVGTGMLARRKIGGISGDVLGATEQVAECLCLVVLSAQAR